MRKGGRNLFALALCNQCKMILIAIIGAGLIKITISCADL